MCPQLSIRNPDANLIKRGQRAKKTPLRSNTSVVPDWSKVYDAKGDLLCEGSIHRGCDDFLYGAVRYIYTSSVCKRS